MTTTATRPAATGTTLPTTGATQSRVSGVTLGAVRVVVGFLFVCHGLQGLVGAFSGIDTQGTAVPFGSWPGWYASMIALVGGGAVLLGLATRVAALVCSGAMAYAYFTVHLPLGLLPLQNLGEQAALFSWIFLLIAVVGPGAFAVDNVIRRARR